MRSSMSRNNCSTGRGQRTEAGADENKQKKGKKKVIFLQRCSNHSLSLYMIYTVGNRLFTDILFIV